MARRIEHVHWPDAPDLWMPYAPAIKVAGGTTVYLAGSIHILKPSLYPLSKQKTNLSYSPWSSSSW